MNEEIVSMVKNLRDNQGSNYTYREIAKIIQEKTGKKISFQYVAEIDKIARQGKFVKSNCHFTYIRRWLKVNRCTVSQFAERLGMTEEKAEATFFGSNPAPLDKETAELVERKVGIPAEKAAMLDRAYAKTRMDYDKNMFKNETRNYAHHEIAFDAIATMMQEKDLNIAEAARRAELPYSVTYNILVGKYGTGLSKKANEKKKIAEAIGVPAEIAFD